MGWWTKIKDSFRKDQPAMALSGVIPIYTDGFGNNIYASDVVQQAVYSIVTELTKLDPVHVRKMARHNDFVSVEGDVQAVLDLPNPMMTTSDFIEKVAWTLLLNYNAFIYPLWDGDKLLGLYPLQPSQVDFAEDVSGKMWITFTFPSGYKIQCAYDDVIHIRHKYSVSEFMGGNINGNPDYGPLLETLSLNEKLLKGLAKSLNIQTSVNGVVKMKTMVNADDQINKIKEFERKLQANESGLLPLDISADYVPITKQVQLLDKNTLEFIDKKILRFFGVSIPIVDGDYTKEQYEAFYQKTLEPIVKKFGQAFTKGLFTKRQTNGYSNKVTFYMKELIFMSTDQKLSLFENLSAQGGVYINEYRQAFGMRPINDLQGVRMMSLNWINAKDAQKYQVGENGSEGKNNGSEGGTQNNEGGADDE